MQEDDKWQLLWILKNVVFVDESPETMLENLLQYKTEMCCLYKQQPQNMSIICKNDCSNEDAFALQLTS